MKTLLVANRGEIAARIMHAAAELGIRAVGVFSEDDELSLHTRRADEALPLRGRGAAAYLDIDQIIDVARHHGCDAIHPGYGFLSENAAFARQVVSAGLVFVGPAADTLDTFGNKSAARALAEQCGVPILRGSRAAVTLDEAQSFFSALATNPAMMIKALAGGGGRGMRAVRRADEVAQAYERCRSEALQAFGVGEVYVEELLPRARHIEVQVVGDGSGRVVHFGDRDCSVQRRHQKLIEIAPSPSLTPALRERIIADALRMAEAVKVRNAGTFEFLVDASATLTGTGSKAGYYFIEANPRLQVEHTVTEEVFGVDLVRIQLELAGGKSLAELGLDQDKIGAPRGFAIQVRINTESVAADGSVRAAGGTLVAFELPSGHGVRVDTCGYVGYRMNPSFDSLLVKLIGHSTAPRFADAVTRTARALGEIRIEGVRTNIPFLRRLLDDPRFVANQIDTRFVEDNAAELAAQDEAADGEGKASSPSFDKIDPLAVLAYGKGQVGAPAVHAGETLAMAAADQEVPQGLVGLCAPMQGTIVSVAVDEGDVVRQGQCVLIMNAMKMEHVVEAPVSGIVQRIAVAEGDTVNEGFLLGLIEPQEISESALAAAATSDLGARADLAEVQQRHAATLDAARPDAVARRRKTQQRTARENIDDLCDPGSFVEYGALALAAQRQRRTLEDLIERTPADGLVAGVGRINGDPFGDAAQCAVLSYDYTVLAGTQGFLNHRKKDRLFELAERQRLPLVIFTEGGGGRPGDTDAPGVAGLDCMAFHLFGRLSGLVPLVGINSGRCFAGNAALLGSCDVVIATQNSNIGMGGPAMIEGGGLGVFRPEEVGPMAVQVANGVVDLAVKDEAQAVAAAKRYLSYFQGSLGTWDCADQRRLRHVVPENRMRVYDVRSVVELLADSGSVLELRRQFGVGMITALVRIEGRPVGVIANNPKHLSGAIDAAAADKAARFMQLCDAFDLPILFLCDTPGIMVGPEAEKTALVRHACRMFVVGASVSVPFFTIVLRKGYGLGAQAMAGGSFKAGVFTVAWPTGEFGGMGLEGAVKLGFRKELEAVDDAAERKKLFDYMVGRAYEHGKGLNMASHFEIDDVIDPAESRHWIMNALRSVPPAQPRTHKKRPCVDTW
ncbi:MAG: carbamoyl-phosphate synthase large subunit [Deltaproteobacteria bacterium]|nr:carbamoyl-phosphate synthase large subunit [Deltaproteobacteria bacterium]